MSGTTKPTAPANVKMAAPGQEGEPFGFLVQKREYDANGRMKPLIFEDLQPVLLARVHPKAAEAAAEAGEKAALGVPAGPPDVANVDLPREDKPAPAAAHKPA